MLGIAGLVALAAACSGGGESPEDHVRRDVSKMIDAALGDDLDAAEFARYSPEECRQDVEAFAAGLELIRAFIGDTGLEYEVSKIEFWGEDRALVTIRDSFGLLDALGGEDEADLWVLQDGRWRSTSSCDAFDFERARFGLSTSLD